MNVSGFTIARNTVRNGYPLEASLRSMLPLVDELVVAVGDSDDGTWGLIESLGEPKIKAFPTLWDPGLRKNGQVLSQQTNLALARCQGDWGLYLQADEVLHEDSLATLRRSMQAHLDDGTEGLDFAYHHFYGSFDVVQDHERKWYTHAVRTVRLGKAVESWGDAMGFRMRLSPIKVRDLKLAPARVRVFHYGWVRPPAVMLNKQKTLDGLYHDDAWLKKEYETQSQNALNFYKDRGNLAFFKGSHPKVMRTAIAGQDWVFEHAIEKQWPRWARQLYIKLFYRLEVRLGRVRRAVLGIRRTHGKRAD